MQQPLAIAIISGLIVQLPLVLLAMPVLFHLMHRKTSVQDNVSPEHGSLRIPSTVRESRS
jgi:hypothetical protein